MAFGISACDLLSLCRLSQEIAEKWAEYGSSVQLKSEKQRRSIRQSYLFEHLFEKTLMEMVAAVDIINENYPSGYNEGTGKDTKGNFWLRKREKIKPDTYLAWAELVQCISDTQDNEGALISRQSLEGFGAQSDKISLRTRRNVYRAGLGDSAHSPHSNDGKFFAPSHRTAIRNVTWQSRFRKQVGSPLHGKHTSEARDWPSMRLLTVRRSNAIHLDDSLAASSDGCHSTNPKERIIILVPCDGICMEEFDYSGIRGNMRERLQLVEREVLHQRPPSGCRVSRRISHRMESADMNAAATGPHDDRLALQVATCHGSSGIAELSSNADLDIDVAHALNHCRTAPSATSAERGRAGIAEELLAASANVNTVSNQRYSETALRAATAEKGATTIELPIIENQAEAEAKELEISGIKTIGAPECLYLRRGTFVPVTQRIDVWSLGCVYATAATWMTLGWQGLPQFEKLRQKAGKKSQLSQQSEKSDTDVRDFLKATEPILDTKDFLRKALFPQPKPITSTPDLDFQHSVCSFDEVDQLDRVPRPSLIEERRQLRLHVYPWAVDQHKSPDYAKYDWHTTDTTREKAKYGLMCALLFVQIGSWVILDAYQSQQSETSTLTGACDSSFNHSHMRCETDQVTIAQTWGMTNLQLLVKKTLSLIGRSLLWQLDEIEDHLSIHHDFLESTRFSRNSGSTSLQADRVWNPSPTAFLAACAVFAFATAFFQHLRRQDRYRNYFLFSGMMTGVLLSLVQYQDTPIQQKLQRFVPAAIIMVLPLSAWAHWLGERFRDGLGRETGGKLEEQ